MLVFLFLEKRWGKKEEEKREVYPDNLHIFCVVLLKPAYFITLSVFESNLIVLDFGPIILGETRTLGNWYQ